MRSALSNSSRAFPSHPLEKANSGWIFLCFCVVENGPDDVMSSSDVTLTSHIGASTFQPAASVRNGNSVASYDTAFYGNENRYNKNQVGVERLYETQ